MQDSKRARVLNVQENVQDVQLQLFLRSLNLSKYHWENSPAHICHLCKGTGSRDSQTTYRSIFAGYLNVSIGGCLIVGLTMCWNQRRRTDKSEGNAQVLQGSSIFACTTYWPTKSQRLSVPRSLPTLLPGERCMHYCTMQKVD